MREKKTVVILGSTGQIGRATLDIISHFNEIFEVIGLSCGSNVDLLSQQIIKFNPLYIAIADKNAAKKLNSSLFSKVKIFAGLDSACELLKAIDYVDIVVVGICGWRSLLPTMEAVKHTKRLALASKEAIVIAGELLMREIERLGVELIPVDSEHSAIFQCLHGRSIDEVERLWLTCSGGPFYERGDLSKVGVKEALAHPRWQMGKKISVDCATLMNKSFEVVEAHHLFHIPYSKINIVIHKEAIIHALVEFKDGSILAQLSVPDMHIPIAYALNYPNCKPITFPKLDLYQLRQLSFSPPDFERFPCLGYGYLAGNIGGGLPAVLVGADEAAVEYFLQNKITFDRIPSLIKEVLDKYTPNAEIQNIYQLQEALTWAQKQVRKLVA